jgi:DNA replication and repair protein RecF
VLVTGANGAGKTNLLESLHVGTQGFSPRTRTDSQLIRFGADGCRVALEGTRDGRPLRLELTLQERAGKRAAVNGAALRAAEQLRGEVATLVFTPDRLAVVKGGPAVRRAYFDRVLARLWPAKASLPVEYGAALAQRNAALRGVAGGWSSREALAPWTERVASLGADLVGARLDVLVLLLPGCSRWAAELGLGDVTLRYDGEPPSASALEARLQRDLDRGATGLGPHLHDVSVLAGPRDLRGFGSQGEQRLTVLALLLAEAGLLVERTGVAPLLLLDDVLSELDRERRAVLAGAVSERGQTLVTATDATFLPVEPAQHLCVTPGFVEAA